MQSNIKIGRTAGILLFIIVALGIPALNLRSISTSMSWSPNLLEHLFENDLQLRISIFMDILVSGVWLALAIFLFPIIKQYRSGLAYWFLGIWILHFAIILVSNTQELSLLSLAQAYSDEPQLEQDILIGLATLKIESYFWSHYFAVMLFSIAMAALYYVFLVSKLIPRILSVWGLIAISVVFVACWLAIFNQDISFALFGQNGVHLLTLIAWLIAKGFNPKPVIPNTLEVN
ncbi:DUF4386 domain-containing protein [Flagellimonas allohymeniacidonis]|uniref:DUF4386 domain-containing protein n=1 Tax=Flagellimonas allohymeniacidonis TaxID=2517819 RepID=A0A4Q8QHC2_9FLAO|nr:DUF4386 domain-containing protein [Allomuricauda hymeniacidonis]TAI49167.1 DUF4386 domain-containing protein [Allomuricauda hymeniacidonis]